METTTTQISQDKVEALLASTSPLGIVQTTIRRALLGAAKDQTPRYVVATYGGPRITFEIPGFITGKVYEATATGGLAIHSPVFG